MKKKTKTKGVSYYKKEADRVFSIYIRNRDSDWRGNCKCCTCPNILPKEKMTAGHWIQRGVLATRFHEYNVHAQCWGCNNKNLGNGRMHVHAVYIADHHGKDVRDELLELSKTTKQMKVQDYKDIINQYQIETPIC